MFNKNQFNRLKKELPDLNKSSLEWFTKWWDKRREIQGLLDNDKLEKKDLLGFYTLLVEFEEFILKNSVEYEKYKIDWKIMEKYIIGDQKFCENIAKLNKIVIDIEKRLVQDIKGDDK